MVKKLKQEISETVLMKLAGEVLYQPPSEMERISEAMVGEAGAFEMRSTDV